MTDKDLQDITGRITAIDDCLAYLLGNLWGKITDITTVSDNKDKLLGTLPELAEGIMDAERLQNIQQYTRMAKVRIISMASEIGEQPWTPKEL